MGSTPLMGAVTVPGSTPLMGAVTKSQSRSISVQDHGAGRFASSGMLAGCLNCRPLDSRLLRHIEYGGSAPCLSPGFSVLLPGWLVYDIGGPVGG
jgi:hypothetical protein